MFKALKYTSTIAVTIFILLTSVMQFHHHDCDGHIYLSLSSVTDIALGQSADDLLHECEHDREHPHRCNGAARCSMHIGHQEIRKALDIPQIIPATDAYGILDATLPCQDPNTRRQPYGQRYYLAFKYILKNLIYTSSIFRAPPLWY